MTLSLFAFHFLFGTKASIPKKTCSAHHKNPPDRTGGTGNWERRRSIIFVLRPISLLELCLKIHALSVSSQTSRLCFDKLFTCTSSHKHTTKSPSITVAYAINMPRPPSHADAPKSDEPSLLFELSESCARHRLRHEKNHIATDSVDEVGGVPAFCQDVINTLRKILPKVEKHYHASRNPKPEDISHICDFYEQVIEGGFCPHAPLIIKQGKHGSDGKICRYCFFKIFI